MRFPLNWLTYLLRTGESGELDESLSNCDRAHLIKAPSDLITVNLTLLAALVQACL